MFGVLMLTKLALDVWPSRGARRGLANAAIFSVNPHGAAGSRPIFYGGDAGGRSNGDVSSPQIADFRRAPRSNAPRHDPSARSWAAGSSHCTKPLAAGRPRRDRILFAKLADDAGVELVPKDKP